jgi:BA14K-like protein
MERQRMAQPDRTNSQPRDPVGIEMRRLRSRAAMAMMVASVAVGFIAGRASVWVLPFEDRPVPSSARHLAAKPEPVAATPQPVAATPQPEPRQAASLPLSAPISDGKSSKPPTPLAALPEEPAQKPAEPAKGPADQPNMSASMGEPARQSVTVLNPNRPDAGRDAAGREAQDLRRTAGPDQGSDGGGAGAAECEKRFSSFRKSDGTYQPYGGGARQRCPLLR